MAQHMQTVTQSTAVGFAARHRAQLWTPRHQGSLPIKGVVNLVHLVRLAPWAHLVGLKVPAFDLLVQGATEEVGHPIAHSQPSDLQQQGIDGVAGWCRPMLSGPHPLSN